MSQPSVARHLALMGIAVLSIFCYAGWRLRHGIRLEEGASAKSSSAVPPAKDTELVTTAPIERQAPSPPTPPAPAEILPLPPSRPHLEPMPAPSVFGEKMPAQHLAPRPLPPVAEKAISSKKEKGADFDLSRNFVWYTVKPGDTLTRIAERYLGSAAKVEEICSANRDIISDRHRLVAGRRIRLPAEASRVDPAISVGRHVVEHVVENAETLVSIAAKYYGSTAEYYRERLRQANPHLPADGQEIKPGTTLVIPAVEDAPAGGGEMRTHVVRQGETLSAIARRVYGSAAAWRKIYEANRQTVSEPDRLQPGMTLVLPP